MSATFSEGVLCDVLGGPSAPIEPLASITVGSSANLGGGFTWGNAEASSFPVRVGPNYKKHGKKEPSNESLYELRGVDIVTNGNDGHSAVDHVAQHFEFVFDEQDQDRASLNGE
jgi:hypothetical protein